MYIAGFNIPLHLPQWIEMLVVFSTADYFRYTFTKLRRLSVLSESQGGRIRPESMPSTFLGRAISPIHGLSFVVPPLLYVGAVGLNGFQQPEWMAKFAISDDVMGTTWRNASRIAACVASNFLGHLTDSTFAHLGDQWHVIGRREKPRIVKTGPYAWVRHPLYSSVLMQQALWAIMFWSYVPVLALGVTASAFAVKMPIEESLIQKDDAVGEEYRKYMKEVPARIIPYVW